ncbi:MAG: iron-sulfur cluster assembly protein [Alphaproteobacteria bacterium]
MSAISPQEVRNLLREVVYPGFSRDVVSAGFIKGVAVSGQSVIITFAPNSSNGAKVSEMEAGIRQALARAGLHEIQVKTKLPFGEEDMALRRPIAPDTESDADLARSLTGPGVMTPLQAELLEDGIVAEPDLLHHDLRHGANAPAAGLGGEPPEPLAGPEGPPGERYEGAMPVFQWDIDPHDAAAESHETSIRHEDWEIRIWWQVHPVGDLLYASLQAMRDDWADHLGAASIHPVGRQAAVNLVFDKNRNGVVAIYGTVRDFRPFVEAFRQALQEFTAGTSGGAQEQAT